MNKSSFIQRISLFLCFCFLTSCKTHQFKLKTDQKKISAKRWTFGGESSDLSKENQALLKAMEGKQLNSENEVKFLSNLFQRLQIGVAQDADEAFLKKIIAKEDRSPFESAILALNVMQTYLKKQEEAKVHNIKIEGDALLAQLCARSNIDLIYLVDTNVFLQTLDSYRLLAKIKKSSHRGGEKTGLLHSIEDRLLQLHDFALINNPIEPEAIEEETDLFEELAEEAAEAKKDSSHAILERVQTLLDSNKFFEAISLLKEIEQQDSLYTKAQEKVAYVSKVAVNDLRKKAARSYQKANQLNTDAKAREVYLVEAKTILQAALNLYPKAQQIDRVKRNLKVIDDNLKFLRKGRLEKR